MEVSTIGLDLAKNVFQVHGVDASGRVVIRKAIRRARVLPVFTKLVNVTRVQLAEFGITIPQGLERALLLARRIVGGEEMPDLPGHGRDDACGLVPPGPRHP